MSDEATDAAETDETAPTGGVDEAAGADEAAGVDRTDGSALAEADGVAPEGPDGAAPVADSESAGGRHVRVVLVDDHRMFRTGVRAEIGQTAQTGVEVVGEAADVDQAVTVITGTRPEVVLLDVHLPGGGGVEVLRRCAPLMADGDRSVRFLALSVSDAAEDVIGVIRGGARGYVTKTIAGTDLVSSIFRVQEGDAVFSPRLAGFVLDAFASTDAPPVDEDLDRLTQREREVLRLIARGYAYKEIAKQLYISVKTVESHVSAVLRKLQLSNRHELTRWATARRLV
uniref:LuxR C-terminal-related transcriptional regulator n=1 Tax=Streptomyces corallincola TaxID=2851888 RepID=UPI0024847B96|nr:response regulator transcription factor [Streptomyces corallincola]